MGHHTAVYRLQRSGLTLIAFFPNPLFIAFFWTKLDLFDYWALLEFLMADFLRNSHNVLNRHTMKWFEGDTLLSRLGRTVCEAEALPRKEFFEAWETAKRIRRHMRGGKILELAAGHGLVSFILLLLDNTSPSATLVDIKKPASFEKIHKTITDKWPRLKGRITYHIGDMDDFTGDDETLVVSVHACGLLTDRVLDIALTSQCRVAVVPCCHDIKLCDTGGLMNWMDGPLAIDATRLARLKNLGYSVRANNIPKDITPKNHLLLGWPPA
jgi:Methyltransferase domain